MLKNSTNGIRSFINTWLQMLDWSALKALMFVEAVLADDWSEETVDSRVATRDSYDPFEVPEL